MRMEKGDMIYLSKVSILSLQYNFQDLSNM